MPIFTQLWEGRDGLDTGGGEGRIHVMQRVSCLDAGDAAQSFQDCGWKKYCQSFTQVDGQTRIGTRVRHGNMTPPGAPNFNVDWQYFFHPEGGSQNERPNIELGGRGGSWEYPWPLIGSAAVLLTLAIFLPPTVSR